MDYAKSFDAEDLVDISEDITASDDSERITEEQSYVTDADIVMQKAQFEYILSM